VTLRRAAGKPIGTLATIVGRNVRSFRDERGLSQPRLGDLIAEKLGRETALPKQVISNIERGKRSMSAEELVATALVLGVPVTELLTAHAHLDDDTILLDNGARDPWRPTLYELREAVMGDAEAAARMEVRRALLAQIIGVTRTTFEAGQIRPVKTKPPRRGKKR
jgi:transcriptional regulator with XRE-family HTH domain